MNALITNPVLLKKIIDALCIFIEKVNIQCSEDGFYLQAVDDSKVCLVSMHLDRKYFEVFNCDSNVVLGVQLHSIQQILKCVTKAMTLKLKTNDKRTKLKFHVDNSGKSIGISTELIDIDTKTIDIPTMEPNISITLTSNDFRQIISQLSSNGDNVNVTVNKDNIFLSPDKNPASTIRLNSKYSKGTEVHSYKSNPFDVCFSLRYLNFFTKATVLSPNVSLEFSENYPLVVKFDFPNNLGYIKYQLALIEDNESCLITSYQKPVIFEQPSFNDVVNKSCNEIHTDIDCSSDSNSCDEELVKATISLIGWGVKWVYKNFLAKPEESRT